MIWQNWGHPASLQALFLDVCTGGQDGLPVDKRQYRQKASEYAVEKENAAAMMVGKLP